MGDFVLHGKDIVDTTLVSLGPELKAVIRFYQFGYDADAIAIPLNAAFKDIRNSELSSDNAEIFIFPLELKRRGARHHTDTGQRGEVVDQIFGQTIAEVFLVFASAQIGEREDRNGNGRRFRCGPPAFLIPQVSADECKQQEDD